MTGLQRRQELLAFLEAEKRPVSGTELARKFSVSRQIIVQDVAILRASHHEILSTNRGYLVREKHRCRRVFSVSHSDDAIQEELCAMVDMGGFVLDVFVDHKAYGRIRADLLLRSRKDVAKFMEDIKSGKSSPLKTLTHDQHFHTVEADSEETLDLIENELKKLGFLLD